jgi:hypothetical protein
MVPAVPISSNACNAMRDKLAAASRNIGMHGAAYAYHS